jgi:hypothetical protein
MLHLNNSNNNILEKKYLNKNQKIIMLILIKRFSKIKKLSNNQFKNAVKIRIKIYQK